MYVYPHSIKEKEKIYMKHYMKKIAVILLAVMMFAALTAYVFAADYTFRTFEYTAQSGAYKSVESAYPRAYASDMAIYFNTSSAGSLHNVRAIGRTSINGSDVNCTTLNGRSLDHVVCAEGTYYSIENVTLENSCYYVTLVTTHNGGYGTVSGKWAPATIQEHATPSAP
jgi:hypothetical protein